MRGPLVGHLSSSFGNLRSGLGVPSPAAPQALRRLGPGRGLDLQRQLRRAPCSGGMGGRPEKGETGRGGAHELQLGGPWQRAPRAGLLRRRPSLTSLRPRDQAASSFHASRSWEGPGRPSWVAVRELAYPWQLNIS